MIYIFGADHGGYVKRMKAATNAVSGGEASLEIKLCQMVHLMNLKKENVYYLIENKLYSKAV